jgi:hypothetical protein
LSQKSSRKTLHSLLNLHRILEGDSDEGDEGGRSMMGAVTENIKENLIILLKVNHHLHMEVLWGLWKVLLEVTNL